MKLISIYRSKMLERYNRAPNLLTIPSEVRLLVYRFLIDSSYSIIDGQGLVHFAGDLSNTRLTCKKIRSESTPVLTEQTACVSFAGGGSSSTSCFEQLHENQTRLLRNVRWLLLLGIIPKLVAIYKIFSQIETIVVLNRGVTLEYGSWDNYFERLQTVKGHNPNFSGSIWPTRIEELQKSAKAVGVQLVLYEITCWGDNKPNFPQPDIYVSPATRGWKPDTDACIENCH